MCTDMCIDMCIDMCVDMCIDMCIDMCLRLELVAEMCLGATHVLELVTQSLDTHLDTAGTDQFSAVSHQTPKSKNELEPVYGRGHTHTNALECHFGCDPSNSPSGG